MTEFNILEDKTFQTLSKRYAGKVKELIAQAPREKIDHKTGHPTPVFAGEIVQMILVWFQKDFSQVVLRRLAEGGTIRDAVRNAQKDFDIKLDEQSENVMIVALEKSFEDEKRKKEEGGVPVVIEDPSQPLGMPKK